MPQFQKVKKKSLLESPLASLGLFVLAIFLVYGAFSMGAKANEAVRNKNLAIKENADLKAKQEKITSDLQYLNTPAGVEETIRNTYRVAKEGEGLVVIVHDDASTTDQANKGGGRFFDKLKSFFSSNK